MDRSVHEWTSQVTQRLGVHGYRLISVDLGDGSEIAGARRANFRFRWAMTKVHTFVLIHEVDVATAEHLRRVSQQSTAYAIRSKGGLPRGFQTGVAVLPVLVCRSADHEAIASAGRRPPKRFGAFTLPMLVDLSQQRFVTHHEPVIWGALYQDFLGEQQRLVAGELEGHVLPPGGERRAIRWMLLSAVGSLLLLVLVLLL